MNPMIAVYRMLVVAVCSVVPLVAADRSPVMSVPDAPKEFFVYFGTYTKTRSKGIYRSRLDVATGRLSAAELAIAARDPAFLAVHPNGGYLYAIDERSDPARTPGKGLAAYAIERGTGKLTLLNEQEVGGPGPCHLAVDHAGRSVLVANYSGGSVAAIALQSDGRLGELRNVIRHRGASVHPTRQKQPHAHAVTIAPDNRFMLTADLGMDRVLVYPLDPAQDGIIANAAQSVALPPGSGPRHLAFHPNGKFVYVINELLCTLAVFSYGARDGQLREMQSLSTLPAGEAVKQGTSTAEVVVHPSGRFVYGSNRGHDSIAVFAADVTTGKLTHVANEPTLGRTPRHFAIDPTGAWLLAENQGSDTVVVFRIDLQTGKLRATGQILDVPVPVCAVFVPVPPS